MAYTPIGWTESTLVNATNLDQMDSQIDTNANDINNLANFNNISIGPEQTIVVPAGVIFTFNQIGVFYIALRTNDRGKIGVFGYYEPYYTGYRVFVSNGSNITFRNDMTDTKINFYYRKITI